MDAATYERRKDGIFRDGRRVFEPSALSAQDRISTLEGTPWTLLHRHLFTDGAGRVSYEEYELRLTNESAGTLGFHVYTSTRTSLIRFATLDAPGLRTEGTRHGLYDGERLVAQLVPSWRDRDSAAGILARVETVLPSPAGDAAALLLFHLEPMSFIGVRFEPDRPLGF